MWLSYQSPFVHVFDLTTGVFCHVVVSCPLIHAHYVGSAIGTLTGTFGKPRAITGDMSGAIWIADINNNGIYKFSSKSSNKRP